MGFRFRYSTDPGIVTYPFRDDPVFIPLTAVYASEDDDVPSVLVKDGQTLITPHGLALGFRPSDHSEYMWEAPRDRCYVDPKPDTPT